MEKGNFRLRTIWSLILIPLLVAAIWFSEPLPWLTILVTIWGALSTNEFYRLSKNAGANPLLKFGILLTMLFIVSPHFNHAETLPVLLSSLIILSFFLILIRKDKNNAALSWAWTVSGVLYVGWLLSYLIALRELDFGREWVLATCFSVFAADSAAYICGTMWGKHKLAPSISPKKTWEGLIAGVLGATIMMPVLDLIFNLPISTLQAVLLGFLIGIIAPIGDLSESMLKRHCGSKDSGNAIPGHGGFLDRIDSIVFVTIVVYYYVIWTV